MWRLPRLSKKCSEVVSPDDASELMQGKVVECDILKIAPLMSLIDSRELSSSELIRVGVELAKLSPDSICICGGEPLCRLDDVGALIRKMVEYDSRIRVSMVSNGLLWTADIAKMLKNAGLCAVRFSLDGMTDESYDFIRRSGGGLSKVFEAVDCAQTAGLDVMLSSVPHRENIGEFENLLRYSAEHNIKELRIQPLMPLGRGEDNYLDIRVSDDDYDRIKLLLREYDRRFPDIKFQWGDPIDHFFMYQEVDYLPVLSVDAYGQVLLSPYLPFTIWDLRHRSIKEFVDLDIPYKVLKLPEVAQTLEKLCAVDDLTSRREGYPELLLGENVDLVPLMVHHGRGEDDDR